jgi:hypothetical protein
LVKWRRNSDGCTFDKVRKVGDLSKESTMSECNLSLCVLSKSLRMLFIERRKYWKVQEESQEVL